jgi:hypothetical protein
MGGKNRAKNSLIILKKGLDIIAVQLYKSSQHGSKAYKAGLSLEFRRVLS